MVPPQLRADSNPNIRTAPDQPETSDTESDLNAIRAELIAEGYLNRKFNPKKQKQNASKPMHFVSSDGFDIYVGKNNTQNDYLTL